MMTSVRDRRLAADRRRRATSSRRARPVMFSKPRLRVKLEIADTTEGDDHESVVDLLRGPDDVDNHSTLLT